MLRYADEILFYLDFLYNEKAREKSNFEMLALHLVANIQELFLNEMQEQKQATNDESVKNVTKKRTRIKNALKRAREVLTNDTQIGKHLKNYQEVAKKQGAKGDETYQKMTDDFQTTYKILCFLEMQVTDDTSLTDLTDETLELERVTTMSDDDFIYYLQFLGQFSDEITTKQTSKARIRQILISFNRYHKLQATSKINLFIQSLENPLKNH